MATKDYSFAFPRAPLADPALAPVCPVNDIKVGKECVGFVNWHDGMAEIVFYNESPAYTYASRHLNDDDTLFLYSRPFESSADFERAVKDVIEGIITGA